MQAEVTEQSSDTFDDTAHQLSGLKLQADVTVSSESRKLSSFQLYPMCVVHHDFDQRSVICDCNATAAMDSS